jgi:hypothetical protein
MAKLTWRHRLARVHPFVWIGVAAVVGGLVAWPLGGWDEVEVQSLKVPYAEQGELVDGRQFATSVDSAELTDVHPGGYETEPGWEYLVLHVTLVNMTDATESSVWLGTDFDGVVTVDQLVVGAGTESLNSNGNVVSADIYLQADDRLNPDLQPRLPAPVTMVWEVPKGTWKVGDEITVGVVDRIPQTSAVLDGIVWRNPYVTAKVKLRVEQGEIAVDDEDGGA